MACACCLRWFCLIPGGVYLTWWKGERMPASLREKAALLADKARRVRPVTLVNDVPKGGDPAEEAAAICRALEPVPAEAWFRDYPGTMKRLEKLNCTVPAFLNARAAARLPWRKTGKRRRSSANPSRPVMPLPSGNAWKRGGKGRMILPSRGRTPVDPALHGASPLGPAGRSAVPGRPHGGE